MRIAVIANILPPEGRGGAEAYAARVAATLAAEHEVLVLSGSASGDVGAARVAALPGLPPLAHDASVAWKLAWHARDQWLPAVHRETARQLAAFAPDVVHTHAIQGLSAAPFTAIAELGLPHVHTAHDLSLLCARVTMTKRAEFCGGGCASCRVQRTIRGRAIKRRLTMLVAVSEYIRRRHVDADVAAASNAVVLRLGADVTNRRVRRPVDGSLNVGFIGALAPHKGIRTLLSVFETTPPTWHLTVAGAGPLAGELESAASSSTNISFLGHISGEEKERFFRSLDVLAIPSEWEEPAALVGTEAAARGIPLVVSDRGGIPELPAARVFRARDAAALRGALDWYAADASRVEDVSRELLEHAEELSWDTHMRGLLEVLETAAQPERSAR